jgi:hypothetical protein
VCVPMRENEQFQELPERDRKHESWLALKAAYEKYQICFQLMDSMVRQQPEGSMAATEFELQERAFEYVEARMDFLECCVDQATAPNMDRGPAVAILASQPDTTKRIGFGWALSANRMAILCILPLVLLCAMAISVIIEKRDARQLQAAFHDLQTKLDHAREALPSAGQVRSASPEGPKAASSPADRKSEIASEIREGQPSRTREKKDVPVTGGSRAPAGAQREPSGTLAYYPFTLSPSRHPSRIGPVIVTVSAIGPKRESVKLSIASDVGRMDLPHLKPNQPVSIPFGNRRRRLQFVVDRIGRSSIKGHLAEPKSRNVEMGVGELTPKSPGRPTE